MDIIDCHVHTQAVADYEKAACRLIKHMRMHGISRMILSDLGDNWVPFPDSRCVCIANDRVQKICTRYPEMLYYLVYLNPQQPDFREEFMLHKSTASGVKLWISLRKENDFSLDNSVKVLQMAAQYGLPVLIHSLECTDGLFAGSVGIDGIIELAGKVPECRIVAAHACGNWRKTISCAAKFPENVFFDISGSYPERTMVRQLVDSFGSERILYGSDAPGRSFGSQLHKVMEAGLNEKDMQNILCRNAAKIFNIPIAEKNFCSKSLPEHIMADLSEDHFCFSGESSFCDHHASIADLAENAVKNGVKKAFTVNLDAISGTDKIAANRKFLREAAAFPVIYPLAVVDLRDAEQTWAQLEQIQGFAGIWISPYLHDYQLNAAEYHDFFRRCCELEIPLWINLRLGDDRFRRKDLKTRDVSESELADFFRTVPENRYIIQGAADHKRLIEILPENVLLEYSRLSDGEYLAEDFSGNTKRLCRGSEYPFRDYNTVDDVLLGRI